MFIQIFYLNTVKVNRLDRRINLIKDNLKALSARVGSFPSNVSGVKLHGSKIQYHITSYWYFTVQYDNNMTIIIFMITLLSFSF